ncbi:unnamed protein product [Notodromas monacha]|uniref:Uncharacterized protein n=1 Tax=Notodromas monacha TaxID=399045 RepID=A0A7R9BCP1_9CRUS|nr:unnamed protein product [Notodromas monacha]CAG0912899.1 unnamed protein product [Notodromas monacha]
MMGTVSSGRHSGCQGASPGSGPVSPVRLLNGLGPGPNGTSTAGEPVELNAILGQASPIITTKREPQDLRNKPLCLEKASAVTLVSNPAAARRLLSPVQATLEADEDPSHAALSTVIYSEGYGPYADHYAMTPSTSAGRLQHSGVRPSALGYTVATPTAAAAAPDGFSCYRDYYAGATAQQQPDLYGLRHYDVAISGTPMVSVVDGASTVSAAATTGFVDRYLRQSGYRSPGQVLSVDLPSPDSGIGAESVTPRDHTAVHQLQNKMEFQPDMKPFHATPSSGYRGGLPWSNGLTPGPNYTGYMIRSVPKPATSTLSNMTPIGKEPGQGVVFRKRVSFPPQPRCFDYSEMVSGQLLGSTANGTIGVNGMTGMEGLGIRPPPMGSPPARSRSWHEFGRQTEADKVQIPKM